MVILSFFSIGFIFNQTDTATELKIGDKAPAFVANDDQGKLWKLEDHLGKKYLIIYFYPAAMTGG